MLAKFGGVFSSWGLQSEYGFVDIDGRAPNFGRHIAEHPAEVWKEMGRSHAVSWKPSGASL